MTRPAYPTHCWLTPKAEVRASAIEGQGLFASALLAADEVVMRLGGRLIDDAELNRLQPPYSSLTVGDGLHLLIDPAHPVRYGNHSCNPNLWHADATTLVARTDVQPDQELTVDYATHTGIESWAMTCCCGSAACRGQVTGHDWRMRRLRKDYGRHWSPPLLKRIDADNGDQ